MGNLALELSRLEMITFIKRSTKEMIGFRIDVQNGKSSSGTLKAGIEHVHAEKQ